MTITDMSMPPDAASAPRREHHAGHIAAIVVGCLMVLPAIGLLLGGTVVASAQAFATDDGYFRFTPDRVSSDGVAVSATDLWLDGAEHDDDAPAWLLDLVDVDLRLRAVPAEASTDLFVGIARAADVERYLEGARFSDVVEMDGRDPVYREVEGSSTVDAPDRQDFWVVSSGGSGEQEIEWDARAGRWSVVVMNVDGSSDVAADIEIGLRSGAVMPIAIAMIVAGVIGVAGGVVLIVVGARGRRSPGLPGPTSGDPLPPPAPSAAVTATTGGEGGGTGGAADLTGRSDERHAGGVT